MKSEAQQKHLSELRVLRGDSPSRSDPNLPPIVVNSHPRSGITSTLYL